MTNKIIAFFFVLATLASCGPNSEGVIMKSLDGNWNKKTALPFSFTISDSQKPRNIIFVVRNNEDYPYGNIRVIANITNSKSKKIDIDTLNYLLAKPNGEWIGNGFGTTKEALFQYRTNYKFPSDGSYTIHVVQAMRQDNLKGVEDFGVKIETAKP